MLAQVEVAEQTRRAAVARDEEGRRHAVADGHGLPGVVGGHSLAERRDLADELVTQHAVADQRVAEVEDVQLRAAHVRPPDAHEHLACLRLGDLELLDHHIGRSDEGCDAPEHAANLGHRLGERRASITLRACSGDS